MKTHSWVDRSYSRRKFALKQSQDGFQKIRLLMFHWFMFGSVCGKHSSREYHLSFFWFLIGSERNSNNWVTDLHLRLQFYPLHCELYSGIKRTRWVIWCHPKLIWIGSDVDHIWVKVTQKCTIQNERVEFDVLIQI